MRFFRKDLYAHSIQFERRALSNSCEGSRISYSLEEDEGKSRTVQLYGGSLTVSLPKKWATNEKVGKGSNVYVFEQMNGTLLVVPENLRSKGPYNVIIEAPRAEDPDYVIRLVVSAYLADCGQILVRSGLGEDLTIVQREGIKELCKDRLIGTRFAELSDEKGRALLKIDVDIDYSDRALPLTETVVAMSKNAIFLHRDAMDALGKTDVQRAEYVFSTDTEVDAKYLFALRALKASEDDDTTMKNLGINSGRECLALRHIVKNIERVADHGSKMAKLFWDLMKDEEAKDSFRKDIVRNVSWKEIVGFSLEAIAIFEDSVKALVQRDYTLANATVSRVSKKKVGLDDRVLNLERNIATIFKSATVEEVSTLTLIVESIRRTADYARGIAEIVLNLDFWETMISHDTAEEEIQGKKYRLMLPSVLQTKKARANR